MSYHQLKKTRKNILASADVSGSYDFWTTIICLDSISSPTIKKIESLCDKYHSEFNDSKNIPIDDFKSVIDVKSLARHEFTHYIDCTSTLWGFKYLKLLSSAYACNTDIYQNTDEENFHIAKSLEHFLRFIRLPKYFTELGSADGGNCLWRYTETIGHRFTPTGMVSDHPILFMRFMDENLQLIVRSPISILSILECSAMAQEVLFKMHSLKSRSTFAEYKVELAQYEIELKKYFYDKSLTEYSACAHLIASKLKINSIFEVFELCSLLCRFVLNTSDEIYDLILKRCNFAEILNIPVGHEFEKRFRKGFEYREPGFLLYLLCKTFQNDYDFSISATSIYKGYLKLGVTKLEFMNSVSDEKIKLMEYLTLSSESYILKIAVRGLENSELIKDESFILPFDSMELPPVYLGDATIYDFFQTNITKIPDYDLEELYLRLHKGQSWVERFIEAC